MQESEIENDEVQLLTLLQTKLAGTKGAKQRKLKPFWTVVNDVSKLIVYNFGIERL